MSFCPVHFSLSVVFTDFYIHLLFSMSTVNCFLHDFVYLIKRLLSARSYIHILPCTNPQLFRFTGLSILPRPTEQVGGDYGRDYQCFKSDNSLETVNSCHESTRASRSWIRRHESTVSHVLSLT